MPFKHKLPLLTIVATAKREREKNHYRLPVTKVS
jgi:hypothetical protein